MAIIMHIGPRGDDHQQRQKAAHGTIIAIDEYRIQHQGKCAGAKMARSHPKEDKTPLGVKLLPASQEPTSLQLRVMEH